jgi:DNA-binding response OmpR family regulator
MLWHQSKATHKHIKYHLLFLSAFADPMDIRKGMDLGADDYLTKPFTSQTLLKTIESRLNIKKKNDVMDTTNENEKWLSFFSGNFNHEFMTPLNGIINSIELMKKYVSKIDSVLIFETYKCNILIWL